MNGISLKQLQTLRDAFARHARHLDQCGVLRVVCPAKHDADRRCMCGLTDALAELDASIADMQAEQFPREGPTGLSHLHPSWVAEVLEVSHQAVMDRIKRGTMPTETHHGTRLVPAWAVAQALERKRNKERK